MGELRKIIGIALRREREKRKITPKQLQDIMDVDKQYLSNIENGHRNITLDKLEEYIVAIGANYSDVIRI